MDQAGRSGAVPVEGLTVDGTSVPPTQQADSKPQAGRGLPRSLRRPRDPSGTTVPSGFALRNPADLLQLLPTRPTRFHAGDRPVGNWVLTWLSNLFTDLNLTDMETCYKVFRREVLTEMTLKSNRFGFEPEVTAKLSKRRPAWRVYEVPISYSGRTYEEGKKIGLKDAFSALFCIVRYWLFD